MRDSKGRAMQPDGWLDRECVAHVIPRRHVQFAVPWVMNVTLGPIQVLCQATGPQNKANILMSMQSLRNSQAALATQHGMGKLSERCYRLAAGMAAEELNSKVWLSEKARHCRLARQHRDSQLKFSVYAVYV